MNRKIIAFKTTPQLMLQLGWHALSHVPFPTPPFIFNTHCSFGFPPIGSNSKKLGNSLDNVQKHFDEFFIKAPPLLWKESIFQLKGEDENALCNKIFHPFD